MSAAAWVIMGKVFAWMLAAGLSGAAIGFAIGRSMGDDDFGGDE